MRDDEGGDDWATIVLTIVALFVSALAIAQCVWLVVKYG